VCAFFLIVFLGSESRSHLCLTRRRSRDAAPYVCKLGTIIKHHLSAVCSDAKLCPNVCQIDLQRFVFHFAIELLKYFGAGRFISNLEHTLHEPIFFVQRSTLRDDCAQRILQPHTITCTLTNRDICAYAKEGPTPICPGPGVGIVKPAIPRFRLTFWHVTDHVSPNPCRLQLSCLHASNRLDISCQTLFDPVMLRRHIGERQVDKLVRHRPV